MAKPKSELRLRIEAMEVGDNFIITEAQRSAASSYCSKLQRELIRTYSTKKNEDGMILIRRTL